MWFFYITVHYYTSCSVSALYLSHAKMAGARLISIRMVIASKGLHVSVVCIHRHTYCMPRVNFQSSKCNLFQKHFSLLVLNIITQICISVRQCCAFNNSEIIQWRHHCGQSSVKLCHGGINRSLRQLASSSLLHQG